MAPAMPEGGDVVDPSPDSGNRMGSATAAPQTDWILDSGSRVHVTGDVRLLREARAPGPGDAAYVTRRDGKEMEVVAVGPIATAEFDIDGVHCAPDLGPERTLVSVPQLALLGMAVVFCATGCLVVDRTGAVVGEGRMRGDGEEDGYYHLSFLRIPRDPPAPCSAQPRNPPAAAASAAPSNNPLCQQHFSTPPCSSS